MNWFKNLNAMPKLMLSFGLILLFTAGIGLMGAYILSAQTAANDLLFRRDVVGLVTITEFEATKAEIATTLRNAVIASTTSNAEQDVETQEAHLNELFAQLQEQVKTITSIVYKPNLKSIVNRISSILPEYEQRCRLISDYSKAGNSAGAAATLTANKDLLGQLDSLVIEAAKIKRKNMEQYRSEQNELAKGTRSIMLSLVGAALLVAFALSFLISRSISLPLIAAAKLLEKLSSGDMTHRLTVTSKDEMGKLGTSLNLAIDSMDRALSEVDASAKSLSISSQQLALAAEALALGAQEQAVSLEETSASLEEITATVRQNSDNASHASRLAASSRNAAEKGSLSAVETVTAMSEIKASSSKIAEIITTIDEIAFQTNLLSVNASVEAARAGSQGNGFKVVATEVRNLAQRSAAAAKEIRTLINSSVRKVENGSTLVTNSGTTLKDIVSSVKCVSDIVGEIAAASQEQAIGIEQVGEAMIQMDRVTQSNSSQTEELSATASSLASQSSHLDRLVSRFILTRSVSNSQVVETQQAIEAPKPIVKSTSASTVSLFSDTGKNDTSRNLESMARNVGHSALRIANDREFEEF